MTRCARVAGREAVAARVAGREAVAAGREAVQEAVLVAVAEAVAVQVAGRPIDPYRPEKEVAR